MMLYYFGGGAGIRYSMARPFATINYCNFHLPRKTRPKPTATSTASLQARQPQRKPWKTPVSPKSGWAVFSAGCGLGAKVLALYLKCIASPPSVETSQAR